MRQNNACLPSLVLDPGRAADMCRAWRYLGFGLFLLLALVCSGTLAALVSPSPCPRGWSDSPLHIAACSTWDEVWSLEKPGPRHIHPSTSV